MGDPSAFGGTLEGLRAYHLGPLRLHAPLPLPLLAADPAADPAADALVRVAARSSLPEEGERFRTSALSIDADGRAWMDMAGRARIGIGGGREIGVAPAPGLSEADVAALLLAGPLAVLLCQRGLVPFRFSVVEVGGVAIVLAGVAGVGKSTLALALAARGARLVSDDLSVLSFSDGAAQPVAWPGTRRIAVWGDISAAVAPGRPARPIRDGLARHFVDIPGSAAAPLPVRAVVLLRLGAGAIASARMQPAEAVARILDRVTERAPIRRLGAEGPLLDTVGRLCRAVPVHHLQRTADLSALPALADRVLALAGGADAP